MPFFPCRRFRLESPLSSEEVAARLAAAVEPRGWGKWLWGMPTRPFEGEAGPDGFRVMRVVWYRNDFRPFVDGRISPAAGGSVVDGTLALPSAAVGFMTVWFGFVALLAVLFGCVFVRDAVNGQWRPMPFVPAVMLAGGWALMTAGFRLDTPYKRRSNSPSTSPSLG